MPKPHSECTEDKGDPPEADGDHDEYKWYRELLDCKDFMDALDLDMRTVSVRATG
jgi:hypothetical protein